MNKKTLCFGLLLTLILANPAFALSNLGEACRYTGECNEGYCLDSICRYPIVIEKFTAGGSCSYTAECKGGFCKEGTCILPEREEYQILTFGVKSGCAGVIENCTGIFCAFCDVGWGLLVVGSVVAAFVGRKRGRLVPFVLFALPVLIGLALFPILGFILALIEVFILAVTKKQTIEVAAAAIDAAQSVPPLQ